MPCLVSDLEPGSRTIKVVVPGVKPIDRTHLLVRFSEGMDSAGLSDVAAFSILDTLSGDRLAVVNISRTDSLRLDAVLVTAAQDSARSYRLSVVQAHVRG